MIDNWHEAQHEETIQRRQETEAVFHGHNSLDAQEYHQLRLDLQRNLPLEDPEPPTKRSRRGLPDTTKACRRCGRPRKGHPRVGCPFA